jgi:hypothetical protein
LSIELITPPTTSKRDKRLLAFGAGLVLVGLLGASQLPVTAAGTISNLRIDPNNSASIIWDGGPLPVFDLVLNDSRMALSRNGYSVNICEYSAGDPVSCDSFGPRRITSMDTRGGETEYTLSSWNELRPPTGGSSFSGELGAGQYVVQFVFLETQKLSSNPDTYGPVVGSTAGLPPILLTVPLTTRPTQTRPQATQTTERSAPAAPTIQIEFKASVSANALLAGNRNFTFEADDVSEVMAVRVNGRSLPIINREEDSFQVKLPKLGPGTYSVIIYTETDNWEIPGGLVIGDLLPEIRKEEIEESFERSSSELPSAAKREIREMIEATPNLRKITVTAIAVREIVRPDGNKLAKARAEAALEFIQRIEPGVIIETKLVYAGDTDTSSRGLVFRVAQKKS